MRATTVRAAVLVAVTAVAGLLLPTTARAEPTATPAPAAAAATTVVTQDALPTVQVDGIVWAQATVGNTVYAVGRFSSVRPAGSPPGQDETPRANILAYDIRTGKMIWSFRHSLNAEALVVTASPDGSRIYVGGSFTQVDKKPRARIAAFSTRTGALLPYAPQPNFTVYAIAATDSTVYLGGAFNAVGTSARTRLAATTATGALLPWAPTANNYVRGIVVAPDGSKVIVGGTFDSVNGIADHGLAAVHPTTGASTPFAAGQQIIAAAGTTGAGILSLRTDGRYVYGASFNYQSLQFPQFEGVFAARFDGSVAWVNDCWGDSYDATPVAGTLYVASHAHNCSGAQFFPEQAPTHRYGLAYGTAPSTRYNIKDARGWDYSAFHTSTLRQWNPSFTTGTLTGQAVWSFTGNARYVAAGGEFPTVNGTGQQGLVRFAVHAAAPNAYGPTGLGAPAARQSGSTAVTVTATTAYDPDDGVLTYALLRDGNATTPVATSTAASVGFWQQNSRPSVSLTDPAAPAGTHAYQIRVTDGGGSTVTSNPTSLAITPRPLLSATMLTATMLPATMPAATTRPAAGAFSRAAPRAPRRRRPGCRPRCRRRPGRASPPARAHGAATARR